MIETRVVQQNLNCTTNRCLHAAKYAAFLNKSTDLAFLEQRVSGARPAGACGSTNTVDIRSEHSRHIVWQNAVNVSDVNTARHCIGADKPASAHIHKHNRWWQVNGSVCVCACVCVCGHLPNYTGHLLHMWHFRYINRKVIWHIYLERPSLVVAVQAIHSHFLSQCNIHFSHKKYNINKMTWQVYHNFFIS